MGEIVDSLSDEGRGGSPAKGPKGRKSFDNLYALGGVRVSDRAAPDHFPTPPWALRALVTHVFPHVGISVRNLNCMTVLEPACGEGYMALALAEFFGDVRSSDLFDYGYAPLRDFLSEPCDTGAFDFVITNPPFKLAEDFVKEALRVARVGVSMLCRSQFVEGIGRHDRLFSKTPPSLIAQFAERVPIVAGRLDPASKTATSYSWFHWECGITKDTRVVWIPPCRNILENRGKDYHSPSADKLAERIAS